MTDGFADEAVTVEQPHQETLDTLACHVPEPRIYLTRDHGAITVKTNGNSIAVNTQHRPLDGFRAR